MSLNFLIVFNFPGGKETFSGFLVWNKLSESKFFFKEDEFQEEINNLLLLMNSGVKIEPHCITQGVCVKITMTAFKSVDFKENDFNAFLLDFLKK